MMILLVVVVVVVLLLMRTKRVHQGCSRASVLVSKPMSVLVSPAIEKPPPK